MTLQEYELEGENYRYWVQGNTKNPPLVIFYGFTGVHKDFLEVARSLKDVYFVIIPEFPGWNNSPRFQEPLTIHNYAKFFKKMFDSLELLRITLLGHCVGAVVAIEFVSLYPQSVEQLILVSMPYLKGSLGQKLYSFLADISLHSPRIVRPAFFFWRSRILTVPLDFFVIKLKDFDKKIERIKDHIIRQPMQLEDAVEAEWTSFIKFNFEKVKQIKTPVRLIHGAEDLFISPQQALKFQKLLPDATLEIIPHAGHTPSVETPKELTELLLKTSQEENTLIRVYKKKGRGGASKD